MDIKYGDVLWADLGKMPKGIQGGVRPVIVIQNDAGNFYAPTLIIVPLTKEIKKVNQPTHCVIEKNHMNGLQFDSMVLGEQIRIISKDVIKYKLGSLNEKEWDNVEKAFKSSFPQRSKILSA